MNPRVGTWNRLSAVAMRFSTAIDLHDRASLQIAHPARIRAMEPRDSAIVYDPEATLEPPTVNLLGPQDDHLPPDLDQRPMSKQVGYAKTENNGEANDE